MRLSIRRLDVAMQGSHILRSVDLEVGDGEHVCLVGRN
jgi:ABC-type branched-subunit amino acid transport system ATPase component